MDPAASPHPARRIALLNMKYSPNLGNGLLAECLEAELARTFQTIAPGTQVFSVDLAGRRAYPRIAPSRRAAQIPLPPAFRRLVTRAQVQLHLRRHVRAHLVGCDAVVLGGGHLLTDSDLGLPMKIAGALAQAARLRLPVAVYGVGANRQWSEGGRRVLARALGAASPTHAAVRDARSQAAWRDLMEPAGVRPAVLGGDPALLASCHFPRPPRPIGAPLMGLCVTAPLRQHTSAAEARGELDAWYGAAARALVDAGFRVALFTSGSPEDRDYLAAMGPAWIEAADGQVTMAAPFADPARMIHFIAGCQLIAAHRLHVCIAAHSFAIPTIGLRRDVKLDSFFALAGRGHYIADTASLDGPALTALARQAAAEGVDRAALEALIAGTRSDIARMAARLARAMQPAKVAA